MSDCPVEGGESAVESPPGATAARWVEKATADAISKKRIKVRMRSLLLRLLRGFNLKPRAPWGSMSNCRLPGAPGQDGFTWGLARRIHRPAPRAGLARVKPWRRTVAPSSGADDTRARGARR